MDALVSIVVPVYNTAHFLPQCITSLQEQTHRNLQIILVNDGSTDSSGIICDAFAKTDPRIQVIHQPNRGVSAARNAGLEYVRGDYLLFVDGDDTLDPETITVSLRGFVNDAVDLVVFGVTKVSETQQTSHCLDLETGIFSKEQILRGILKDYASMGAGFPVNKLWRVQAFGHASDIPRFDESLYFFEDLEWVVRMILQIRTGNLLPHHFYHYYIHTGSATHNPEGQERREVGYHQSVWKILPALQQEPQIAFWFSQKYYPEIINGVIHGWKHRWPVLRDLLIPRLPHIRHTVLHSHTIPLKIKLRLLALQLLTSFGLL